MTIPANQAPATKGDLQCFLQIIMTTLGDIERRMATKEDLTDLEERLEGKMATMERRMDSFVTKQDLEAMEHRLLVVLETQRKDIFDVHDIKIGQLDKRMNRVERQLQI